MVVALEIMEEKHQWLPYKSHRIRRGGSPSRPSAARPLRGRVDEDIDPYNSHRTL